MHGTIRRLTPGLTLCGPALTVEARPGDNLLMHAALAIAKPGDVLVVDGRGDMSCALAGGLMGRQAKLQGLAGWVVDGALRDIDELAEIGLPAFARGSCPGGPDKEGPGRVGVTITCGGQVVEPGDIIVGDADGVAVIPRAIAAAAVGLAEAKTAQENERRAEMETGRMVPDWLMPMLRKFGALKEGETL
jgi:RraA family protein